MEGGDCHGETQGEKWRVAMPARTQQTPHFFSKKEWLSSGVWAAKLRQCQWCIVVIDFELHAYVTLNSPPVPIPPDGVIENVLYMLGRLVKHGSLSRETGFERRLEILIYLFEGAAPATAKALRAQLDVVHEYYAGSLG